MTTKQITAVNTNEKIDLRSLFFRDLEPEGLAELTDNAVDAVDRIAHGNVGTLLAVAHLLAPHVAHDVVGKSRTNRVGRSRAPLEHVGHLAGSEIRVDWGFVTLCLSTYCCHHHGDCR